MKVKFNVKTKIYGWPVNPGDVKDINPRDVKPLIESGEAELYKPGPTELPRWKPKITISRHAQEADESEDLANG